MGTPTPQRIPEGAAIRILLLILVILIVKRRPPLLLKLD